jgi:2-haloacid dehalogenase
MKAILFDVFGTVVDWRSSLIAQFAELARETGQAIPGGILADQWRGDYAPSMDRVRRGELPWTVLDDLHRQSLDRLLAKHGLDFDEAQRQRINRFWHRLEPWPDSVAGLTALRRHYTVGSLTNGNLSLMLEVARHAGLPWHLLLCADLFRHYKPDREVYLGACALLRLPPHEVMLCAAHNADLAAAQALGLNTAFIPRPGEYGPTQSKDLCAEGDWDYVAEDILDLAIRLQTGDCG